MSENGFLKLKATGKCPICGGKLDTVYITDFKGIVGLRPYLTRNIPALKCEHCHTAIFSYEETTALGNFMKRCVKCNKEIPLASEECQYCGASQLPEKEGVKP